MSEENVAVVQAAYNHFKTGNIPGLVETLADDVEWQLPVIEGVPFTGKRTGKEAVVEFFASVGEHQDSLQFEPREFVAQGDNVVSLGHYKWRVKSTGREFESDFVHVFTIRDGKTVAFQEYMDTADTVRAYRKAMGA